MKTLPVVCALFLWGTAYAGHPNAAMYQAALKGDICAIAKAISSGGTVNEQYPFSQGRTPLMAAIISGDWNTVNLLLRFGADPRAKNNDRGSKEFGWSALEYAAHYKNKDKTTDEERTVGISIQSLIETYRQKH